MAKSLLVLLALILGFQSRAENYPPTFRDVKLGSESRHSFFTTQLAADSVGNTFWAGAFRAPVQAVGSLSFTNNYPDDLDAFVFKLGPNLDERWVRSGGGSGEQWISGLAVDANRDCYFAVNSGTSNLNFDNTDYSSPSNQFSVVFKYSRGGNKIWAHQINGVVLGGWAKSLCVDQQTNIIFGGTFADERGVLRKLDVSGQTLWSRVSTKVNMPLSYAVQSDLEDNCFLLTSFTSPTATFGTITVTNQGIQNYVLVKYDSAGNEIWAKVGGGAGPGHDFGVDIAVDTNGHAYVWSAINSTNAVFGTNYYTLSDSAWFVTKYNKNGKALWATQAQARAHTAIGGISIDRNNNILLNAGAFDGVASSSAFLGSCTPGGQMLWIKRIGFAESEPYDEIDSMVWTSRIIDVPTVGLSVAGQIYKEQGTIAFDSFAFSTPFARTFFTQLAFDPRLSTLRDGNSLTLSWPTNEAGFFLESSEHLDGTNEWSAVTNSVVLQNGQHAVTNLISGTNAFYRLRKTLP